MNRIVVLSACLLLAAPALAQSVGEKSGVNSARGVAPTRADFVKEAASHRRVRIQSSRLAADKAGAATMTFATRMIADHEKTSSELKSLAITAKVDVPTAMLPRTEYSRQAQCLNGGESAKQYQSDRVQARKNAVSHF